MQPTSNECRVVLRPSRPTRREASTIPFVVPVDEMTSIAAVMRLATNIVEVDATSSSVVIRFNGRADGPHLIGDVAFRKFAILLNRALPSWPFYLANDSDLPIWLVLASLDSIKIGERADNDSILCIFSHTELAGKISKCSAAVKAAFPYERCIWSEGAFLQRLAL